MTLTEAIHHLEVRPKFRVEKSVQLGGVHVGYRGFGEAHNITMPELGYGGRFAFPQNYDVWSMEAQNLRADHAADMIVESCNVQGWDSIDILVTASISSYDTLPALTADRIQSAGITVNQDLFYGYACHGGTGAVMDILREDLPVGTRVAVACIETLTGNVMNPADIPKHNLTREMFGIGSAWITFEVGRDFTYIDGATIVVPGDELCIPRGYTLPDESEAIPPLRNYYFKDGAEKIFMRTKQGSRILMSEADPYTEMNGQDLLFFFAKYGAQLYVSELHTYWDLYEGKYGPLQGAWIHQPSLPVLEALNKETIVNLLRSVGISERKILKELLALDPHERIAKIRKEITKYYREPEPLPWVMRETPFNNVSSATPLIELTEMIEKQKITTGRPFPVIGLGIGNIIETSFVRIDEAVA